MIASHKVFLKNVKRKEKENRGFIYKRDVKKQIMKLVDLIEEGKTQLAEK